MIKDFLQVIAQDCLKILLQKSGSTEEDTHHLQAAVSWLKQAYHHADHGFSKAYKMFKGWMPPYPETSGYIIGTYLALNKFYGDDYFKTTALETGQWLAHIQLDNGGIIGREVGVLDIPIVFDTGQVLHGFVDLMESGYKTEFTDPALKACTFLMESQNASGCFDKNMGMNLVHTYNVRSAWAMIRAGLFLQEKEIVAAGQKNIDWALTQQLPNGFFLKNNFRTLHNSNTHAIGYTHRGFLESYKLLHQEVYLEAVVKGADRLVELYKKNRYIPADLGENWEYLSKHLCLTGYAQNAIVLLKLWQITHHDPYRDTAYLLIEDVKSCQDIKTQYQGIFGGIRGSYPLWGRYAPLQYPNWAAKFFIDALLLKMGSEI